MKTVMKKIFSLMLVAVLLVSAVPFQASAAANDLAVMVNGEMKSLVNTDSTSYDACLAAAGIDTAAYEITDVSCEYTDAEGNVQTVSGFTAGAAAFELMGPTRVWFKIQAKQAEPATLTCDTCGETYTEGTEHTCPTLTCDTCGDTYTKGTEHTCATLTCDTCGDTYTKGTEHTCATLTCDTCGDTYTKGTEHDCDTVTCSTCGHVYVAGTGHTCAKETCEKCDTTYIKAVGHVCTVPENPVTYKVHFVADPEDRDEIYWSVEVLNGKTVKNPGIDQDPDWECLNKVGDTDNLAFVGWSTNKKATIGDYSTASVVLQPITGGDRTYYAIYKEVNVAPPTSSVPGNITNKDNTNKVYLHVYLNGNASVIQLTKDITEYDMLKDDTISASEVWTYLTKNYYGTGTAEKPVKIDGLYVNTGAAGTFPQNYYTDKKVETLENVSSLLDKGYVHINVMMKDVPVSHNSGSSANADSTNPKTGDMIMAPAMVLGLSASALAVLFFLNKKRAF